MKKFLAVLVGISVVAGAALIGVCLLTNPGGVSFFSYGSSAEAGSDNPYAYTIDSLAAVDSSLIGYREGDAIPLNTDGVPQALAVGLDGGIYVSTDDVILILNDNGGVATRIEVGEPVTCLTVSEDGRLFAGSRRNVRVYERPVEPVAAWEFGAGRSYFTSIAVGEEDIFVADAGMRVVWRLDTTGAVTAKIGLRDTARGIPGFVVPSPYMDVAIGRDGSLWVVNPGRHLLENYRPNGDRLSAWGSSGGAVEGFAGCCNPVHMTMLDDGSFVTAEKGIVRVKIYDQTGRFRTVVAPHKAFNPGEANLDLAVDPLGQILVLDSYGKKIRVFQKKSI